MKARFLPPPSRDALSAASAHAVVRDFPESLAVFRREGVALDLVGHLPVADLAGSTERLISELEAVLRWRGAPGTGEA